MIPVEIHSSSWQSSIDSPLENVKAMETSVDLVDETREAGHLREFAIKRRAAKKYESK
ncbi:hypothetical protein A2U01_0113349, partial [Trifolium medium]|nr:hypothetical protein [Trifolium medium]